jgi:8-oxo-dGTP pyrophosphatase MutT (NUDIX family)
MAISNARADKRKQWKKELSAGGVVMKDADGVPCILLIKPAPYVGSKGIRKFSFPKGWVGDHGKESHEEAALREVREEGGVKARILADLGTIRYFFSFRGDNIAKTVHFFLMEYVSGDPKHHDHEVEEAVFVPLEEARGLLARKTDLEILARAEEALRKK